MSGHVHAECRRPWFWKRRYVHRPWICDCSQAWVSYWGCAGDGCVIMWRRWPARESPTDWGLQSPEVDDS